MSYLEATLWIRVDKLAPHHSRSILVLGSAFARALGLGHYCDHGVAVAGIVVGVDFLQSREFKPFRSDPLEQACRRPVGQAQAGSGLSDATGCPRLLT